MLLLRHACADAGRRASLPRMDEKDHGARVAGRIVYELEAVGLLALVLAVVALVSLQDMEQAQWYAVAAFLFVAAVAFGMLANAVLRR